VGEHRFPNQRDIGEWECPAAWTPSTRGREHPELSTGSLPDALTRTFLCTSVACMCRGIGRCNFVSTDLYAEVGVGGLFARKRALYGRYAGPHAIPNYRGG